MVRTQRPRLRLMLRWSWRDLRAHWAKVVAIALVIAIGTGGYAGLTSTVEWRRVSYDFNYRQLAMYDLRVDLAPGSSVEEGTLAALVAALPVHDKVGGVAERLIVPTQVDASTPTDPVLVRGEIVGSDFTDGGPEVGRFYPWTGRLLTAEDNGAPVVMVERNFARFYGLADRGVLTVSGGRTVQFVGQATTPEYFTVAPAGEAYMSEATFAAMFTTLDTAQQLAGLPDRVNNLVLTVTAATDRDLVAAELEDALVSLSVGATVSTRDDDLSFRALNADIDNDQALFNFLAVLLLAGAVGAAFNLITRLVEQQRREIGIGMALGVRSWVLAVRPLMVSAQIALLGVVFGIVVGLVVGDAMGGVFTELVPLPIWDTSFQTGVFARVAVLGLIAPIVATIIPVWRATRVTPMAAIKPLLTGRGVTTGRRHSRRNTFAVMPVRNLRRAPRRTALTVAGIAAAVTVLVGFLGIMDSVFDAIDTAERETAGNAPDRVTVTLDGFYPVAADEVIAVGQAATVAATEPGLQIPATVRGDRGEIDLFVELVDFDAGIWQPTISTGAVGVEPGVVLTERAAADLGVRVGDTVVLRHPVRQGLTGYVLVDSDLPVVATHPHPVRSIAYLDAAHAELFNLDGITNTIKVIPAAGAGIIDVQRELFTVPGVASAQSVTAATDAVRDAFDQFLEIVQIMVAAVLVLVLMIAFNTAAINLDARAREHATMFAFGVKVKTALRMAVIENVVVGTLATLIGIAGGLGMVWWMTQRLLTETLPEFALGVALRPATVTAVIVLGIGAVAAAPLLTIRRMHRLDLPGTLRLVE